MRAIIIAGLFIFICPINAIAEGIKISEDAAGNNCAQCDEMCKEPVEGESVESLSNWICQQCLNLCNEQNKQSQQTEQETEIELSPCSAPVT